VSLSTFSEDLYSMTDSPWAMEREARGGVAARRVAHGRVGQPPEQEVAAAEHADPHAQHAPGVMTFTQPNVPEAQIGGSQKGLQCVLVSPERVPGVQKGVRRGPVGPPAAPFAIELAALCLKRVAHL
jgi:hypothetical protein